MIEDIEMLEEATAEESGTLRGVAKNPVRRL